MYISVHVHAFLYSLQTNQVLTEYQLDSCPVKEPHGRVIQ